MARKRTVTERAQLDQNIPPADPLPFEKPWDKLLVAQFLGVTASGLDKVVKDGKAPPHFKAGRMLRWRPSVVKAWALDQEQRAAAEAAKAREASTSPTV